MASAQETKRRLIEFLDRKAFDPILKARPDDYPEGKRAELKHVQDATCSERERFHSYETAEKVVQMFHDDLSSSAAEKVHRQLRDLGLPTISEVRNEFDRLAGELGVGRR